MTTQAATRMATEMAEQPDACRRTLEALVPLRAEIVARYAGRRRVLFAARGSSDNAAIYGRYLLETHAGVSGALVSPSVATHYGARLDLSDALVVSVSQSGATEEIVATQDWARECGAATIAVANVADSPLVEGADLALVTQAGPEVAVPATKSYLAQLVAMAVLGTALAPDPDALDDDLARVAGEVERLLSADVAAAVDVLTSTSYAVVSGRGLMMGTALETALKLEETCLRPVRGYSYADFRHGPISVVADGTAAVLVSAADGPMVTPMTELARDLSARGAQLIGIGGDAAFADALDVALPGPDLPETLAPIGSIVTSQVLVERLAHALGLDPDNPRGLAKVTATEPPKEQ
ncbi:glucosamine-6-phosphate deaminase [Marmoricola endophyticus]|uniref:Glucosamine-6-phosphate deaminase n=1 Tax=Marmoricola endophyticus TaxID=2040280 RepID=A0A917BE88_9ACTN|nr:SIS domain-containing protein [Marmoricola endophyticus]GGF38790.1 glucosamine-6-phosphate deaminase [Marmoricola endophyticus]